MGAQVRIDEFISCHIKDQPPDASYFVPRAYGFGSDQCDAILLIDRDGLEWMLSWLPKYDEYTKTLRRLLDALDASHNAVKEFV